MVLPVMFAISLIIIAYFANKQLEGFTGTDTGTSSCCPDLLIQNGSKLYLYNSKKVKVPGVNPIEFNSLEDYSDFVDWQRSKGLTCPVLYLQNSYNADGTTSYVVRPNVFEPQGGLPQSSLPQINGSVPSILESDAVTAGKNGQVYPMYPSSEEIDEVLQTTPNSTLLVDANHTDPPYNNNQYASYDSSAYYVGKTTPLDAISILRKKQKVSFDPLDANWGGAEYTQKLIDQGYFKGNEVSIYIAE